MARTSVDVTYATKDGSEPRTPGRPIVHAPSDRNPAQPHATPVAMRIDTFGNAPFVASDGREYMHIRPTYLHAQETDQKEPQPYAALSNRPKYGSDHRLVQEDGKPVYTNEMIVSYDDFKALASAASHAREDEPGSPDIRRVKTKNDSVLTSLYVEAPMEFVTDNLAPENRNTGRKPVYLRPIASRATRITENTIPDPKFWVEVDGVKSLDLDAVDSFQKERAAELSNDRELIRTGRGREVVSKLTGKPFGESNPSAEQPMSAPMKANGLDDLFANVKVDDYQPSEKSRDAFADSLGGVTHEAQGPDHENAPSPV